MFQNLLKNHTKTTLIILVIILYVGNIFIIFHISPDTKDIFLPLTDSEDDLAKFHKYNKIQSNENKENVENAPKLKSQSDKIKQMMQHAWKNYKLYAWGKNELNSINKTHNPNTIFGTCEFGASIIDALDTLYIMNLMEEYEEGKAFIANEFDLDQCDMQVSVFELNIRVIGGLLSLFALTSDILFKEKAIYVSNKILSCFGTSTGIPYPSVMLTYNMCVGMDSSMAKSGSFSLEFNYLSKITEDEKYAELIKKVNKGLRKTKFKNGLYPKLVYPYYSMAKKQEDVKFGGEADSFYEYLLKVWIQSGKKDDEMKNWFIETMDPVIEHLLKKTKSGKFYITEKEVGNLTHKMDHLSCFAGGFFALAAKTDIYFEKSKQLLEIGKELTETCRHTYATSNTGLGPEEMQFYPNQTDPEFNATDASYRLRPETIESYFFLHRITKDQKYRKYAWNVVESIERYCKTPFGYSGIENVNKVPVTHDGVQQSFFLAETLKYLYLIFEDDTVLSLDQYVFNTEAHPLPIHW